MSIFTNENIVSGSVDVNNFPASQPVTGPLTDIELRATPVPVSIPTPVPVTGTFYQATQPISGTISIDNFPATQPVSIALPVAVTGTFYQATQPVSIASMPSTPVTGTFWQAVQPVSGPLTDTELRATPVPISGSVSTTPVVATSSTVTQVTSNSSNQTLLAANANRRGAVLLFESGIWSVKLGATASTTSKTYSVSAANTLIEIPDTYQGIVDARCTTSNKLVDVTELTA